MSYKLASCPYPFMACPYVIHCIWYSFIHCLPILLKNMETINRPSPISGHKTPFSLIFFLSWSPNGICTPFVQQLGTLLELVVNRTTNPVLNGYLRWMFLPQSPCCRPHWNSSLVGAPVRRTRPVNSRAPQHYCNLYRDPCPLEVGLMCTGHQDATPVPQLKNGHYRSGAPWTRWLHAPDHQLIHLALWVRFCL